MGSAKRLRRHCLFPGCARELAWATARYCLDHAYQAVAREDAIAKSQHEIFEPCRCTCARCLVNCKPTPAEERASLMRKGRRGTLPIAEEPPEQASLFIPSARRLRGSRRPEFYDLGQSLKEDLDQIRRDIWNERKAAFEERHACSSKQTRPHDRGEEEVA